MPSPDGLSLASSTIHRTVQLWQVEDQHCVATLEADDFGSGVTFSLDGRLLALGSEDTVRLWRVKDWHCMVTLEVSPRPGAGFRDVGFSPDGLLLAYGGQGVRLCRVEDMQCIATLEGHASSIAFCPDKRRLLASGGSHGLFLWNPGQTLEMTLEQIIVWEKKYAGQYSEIRLVE